MEAREGSASRRSSGNRFVASRRLFWGFGLWNLGGLALQEDARTLVTCELRHLALTRKGTESKKENSRMC